MTQRPLQELRLRDFRCFQGQQTARLAPLTLLVGENSTGKTSFLAAVRAVLEVARYHAAPDFRAPPYDLGTFHEIAHRPSRGGDATSFDLGFRRAGSKVDAVSFEAAFTRGPEDAPAVSVVTWSAGDVWLRELRGPDTNDVNVGSRSEPWRLPFPIEKLSPFAVDMVQFGRSVSEVCQAVARSGFLGKQQPPTEADDSMSSPSDLRKLAELLRDRNNFSARTFAGAPIRSSPLRTYDPARPVHDLQGLSTPAFLADLYAKDAEAWQNMKDDLEDFGRSSGLFDEIFVRRSGGRESASFQLEVRKADGKQRGTRRNLIDVGYGVSQVLPLLVELRRRDGAMLVLLQQPEVHLHPSAQAELGSLLCAIAAAGRQLIVETHSEYVVDRIRMDIRDRTTELKPQEVSILFFERKDLDVHIHSLKFDEQGNLLNAPDAYGRFFMDETRRSIGL